MGIEELAVPEMDWDDIVKNPWTLRGDPKIAAEINAIYVNGYSQTLKVVGKNTERGELYAFYVPENPVPGLGEKDIHNLITVQFSWIEKYERAKS